MQLTDMLAHELDTKPVEDRWNSVSKVLSLTRENGPAICITGRRSANV